MDYRVHTDRNKSLLKAICYLCVGWFVSPNASSMSHVECSNDRQYRPPMSPLKKLISYANQNFQRPCVSALCYSLDVAQNIWDLAIKGLKSALNLNRFGVKLVS